MKKKELTPAELRTAMRRLQNRLNERNPSLMAKLARMRENPPPPGTKTAVEAFDIPAIFGQFPQEEF